MTTTGRGSAAEATALAKLRAAAGDPVEAIRLACVWEATAPKVGNVHPGAAFDDCDFLDFCRAAEAVAPILAGSETTTSPTAGLGERILAAIEATRAVTRANVNLGIVLLIAPLAAIRQRHEMPDLLRGLQLWDGELVYRAIRLANPGGVRDAQVEPSQDVTTADAGGVDLLAAMASARERDRIALQYATDFADFFDQVVPVVAAELESQADIAQAIVRAQIRLLAAEPDSLIARKSGPQVAAEVCRRASVCQTATGDLHEPAVAQLDGWLRADGNRRNPGTTADLIAAALFWLIRPDPPQR